MSLTILDPGLASRVVDFGRPRVRSLGMSVGGAADRAALSLGNGLVGNPPDSPGIEICLKGPVLRADEPVAAVVFGAPFSVFSNRQSLRAGVTFTLIAGEELHIGGTPSGMRGYLCVAGGFEAETILGSRSALESVRAGEVLRCPPGTIGRRFLPPAAWEISRDALRVMAGLQEDWFAAAEFYDQSWTVTPALDRMGIRLQGKPLNLPSRELVSEPVCPGAVQVTRDGQCIVLGVDGQTIGGYPKIAQVIQADLDRLGQLRPGEAVRFEMITLEKAIELHRQREDKLHEWLTRLRVTR